MKVETVATILGIGTNAVLYHIAQGNLVAKKYGRAYEVEPVALVDFFENHWAQSADMSAFLAGVPVESNKEIGGALVLLQFVLSTRTKNPRKAGG